jgi:hypothetical protein
MLDSLKIDPIPYGATVAPHISPLFFKPNPQSHGKAKPRQTLSKAKPSQAEPSHGTARQSHGKP